MNCLVVFISLASLLHAGQSAPSYTQVHNGYGSAGYAPVGYNGPLAKPIVLPDGHIADTPEVAAAKNMHFSAVHKAQAEAAARGYSDGDDGSYRPGAGYGSGSFAASGHGSSYGSGAGFSDSNSGAGYGTGSFAASGHGSSYGSGAGFSGSNSGAGYGSGSFAASGHGSSYGSGAGFSGYNSGAGYASSRKTYSGPLAYPKVLPSGLLADTQDEAAARQAHLNAVAVTAREHAEKWRNNYYH